MIEDEKIYDNYGQKCTLRVENTGPTNIVVNGFSIRDVVRVALEEAQEMSMDDMAEEVTNALLVKCGLIQGDTNND